MDKNVPILSDSDHACCMIMDKMSEGALVLTVEEAIAYFSALDQLKVDKINY